MLAHQRAHQGTDTRLMAGLQRPQPSVLITSPKSCAQRYAHSHSLPAAPTCWPAAELAADLALRLSSAAWSSVIAGAIASRWLRGACLSGVTPLVLLRALPWLRSDPAGELSSPKGASGVRPAPTEWTSERLLCPASASRRCCCISRAAGLAVFCRLTRVVGMTRPPPNAGTAPHLAALHTMELFELKRACRERILGWNEGLHASR